MAQSSSNTKYHPPPPDKKLPYTIPGDDADEPGSGCLFVYGQPSASKLVFASVGFPDDQTALAGLAAQLAVHHDCLVGVVCPLGFDHPFNNNNNDDKGHRPRRREGYRLSETTSSYQEALKVLRGYSTKNVADTKLIYLLHDWGYIFGMQLANRNLKAEQIEMDDAGGGRRDGSGIISSSERQQKEERMYAPHGIVSLDILHDLHPAQREQVAGTASTEARPPLWRRAYSFFVGMVFYQLYFVALHLIYYYIGPKMAAWATGSFFVLAKTTSPLNWLFPMYGDDEVYFASCRNKPEQIAYMCHVYYNLWKSMLMDKKELEGAHVPNLDTTAFLFLHGTDKNAPFHFDTSKAILEQRARTTESPGRCSSRVVAVENAGHWMHLQQPDVCLKEIVKFMNELE